jgi:heme exporter protein CcmD
MTDFLAQGGYAFYVWVSYAVSLSAVGLTVALTLAARRKAARTLRRLENRKPLQHSETNL